MHPIMQLSSIFFQSILRDVLEERIMALDPSQLSHPQKSASDWPQELAFGLSSSTVPVIQVFLHSGDSKDAWMISFLVIKGLEMSLFRLVLWNSALKTASVFRKQHSFYCLQEKWHTAHYYIMIAQVLIQENVYTSKCFDSFLQIKSPPK